MRYFISFAYDGTNYHGWQIQPNGNTVQAELQKALTTFLREPIEVVGAGRTDTGVHARYMVAHFDYNSDLDVSQLTYRLNRILPKDITIYKLWHVAGDMHARFSATRRTYRYYLHTQKDPFLRHYSLETHYNLDFDAMNLAAKALLCHNDFAAFCKSGADVKTTLCTIYDAAWHQTSDHSWYFEITANRFLRNMVRAIVGTLVEVGRSRITIEQFQEVIRSGKRTQAGESMPAHALFLESINY